MYNVSDYLHQKASRNRIPINGSFELSPVCNFSCKMCYVRKTPAQIQQEGKQLIPWQKWLELAKQCYEAGTLYLLLTGGEPFLYPNFRELYEALHKMGFIISINSNGTMIDEETVEWLKNWAPCRVNVTLYGASPKTYKRICGHADGFEKALKAIKMLKEANIPVVINASMIPENADDMEEIAKIGKELGLNTRISTYMFPPLRRTKEESDSRFTAEKSAEMFIRKLKCQYSNEQYLETRRKYVTSVEQVMQQDKTQEHTEYMRCRAGRSTFWVNWEGYMTACGMLDFPLRTEPFERPFLDCWKELTNCVRTTPVLKGCANCDKKEICNPCVAMIYAETGTTDQKSEYMCQLTEHVFNRIQQEDTVNE